MANCIRGTTSIKSNVAFGEKPNFVNMAYVNEPATPAAPVPDDHADMTFLFVYARKAKKNMSEKKKRKYLYFVTSCLYTTF